MFLRHLNVYNVHVDALNNLVHNLFIHFRIFISMVFIEML